MSALMIEVINNQLATMFPKFMVLSFVKPCYNTEWLCQMGYICVHMEINMKGKNAEITSTTNLQSPSHRRRIRIILKTKPIKTFDIMMY